MSWILIFQLSNDIELVPVKIGGSGSLRLSGCLTGCGDIGRCRFALSASKSRGMGGGGDGGGRAEMLGEFWPCVSGAL